MVVVKSHGFLFPADVDRLVKITYLSNYRVDIVVRFAVQRAPLKMLHLVWLMPDDNLSR